MLTLDPGKREPHSHRNVRVGDHSRRLKFTRVAYDPNTHHGAHWERRKCVDITSAGAQIGAAARHACLRTKVEHFRGRRKGKSSLRSTLGTADFYLFFRQRSGDYDRHVGAFGHFPHLAAEHTSAPALS